MGEMEKIREVMLARPELSVIEDISDACKERGVKAGFWQVYFTAKGLGREVTRRPPRPIDDEDLRDLARTLFGLHQTREAAVATLDRLETINAAGTRVKWEKEQTQTEYGWELSVA